MIKNSFWSKQPAMLPLHPHLQRQSKYQWYPYTNNNNTKITHTNNNNNNCYVIGLWWILNEYLTKGKPWEYHMRYDHYYYSQVAFLRDTTPKKSCPKIPSEF